MRRMPLRPALLASLVLLLCGPWCVILADATLTTSGSMSLLDDLLWHHAMALYEQKQYGASASVLQQLAAQRDTPDATVEAALGASFHVNEQFELAHVHYARALAIRPRDATTLANVGSLHFDLKHYARARGYFERAIDLDASLRPRLLHSLAICYHYMADYTTAESLFAQVPLDARTAQYHYDRAVTLERLGNVEAAGRAYNDAIAADQQFARAWHNIAALHQKYGEIADSIRNYLRALSIASASRELRLMSMTNLAIAYEITDDVQAALVWYGRARALTSEMANGMPPDQRLDAEVSLQVHVARAKRTACLWEDYEIDRETLQHRVRYDQLQRGLLPGLQPFDTLLTVMDPAQRLAIARSHANAIARQATAMFANHPIDTEPNDTTTNHTKLRVGYASYDFNDHPTAHLLEGVFAFHDRTALDAIAFGYGKDDGSDFRTRLRTLVGDAFVNLAGVSTPTSVASIRAQQLDVLMDAQGHTRGAREHITAVRPASIVVNYLVYPGTSGAGYVDYVVSDRRVTPPDTMASHFSEKLVLLPHAYQVNYYPRAVVPHGRAWLWTDDHDDHDTAPDDDETSFTFVNFNKIDKLEPVTFALWMAILRRVPQSRLLLLNPKAARRATTTSDEIVRNLRLEATAHGVDGARLTFVPRVTKRDHLQRHRVGGLFLDTLVYGAHSTATDALYAGLPVLTLAGDAFASRVGVSLLHNVGLAALVTHSLKEFEDLAVAIATERPMLLLSRLRAILRTHDNDETDHKDNDDDRSTPQLFRTRNHVAALEAAQRVMVSLHRRSLSAKSSTTTTTVDAPRRTAHIVIV